MSVVINIILILASILLIVVVLMQEGNKQGLGVIGGAAETFLGKNKAKSYEGKLLMITRILAAVFVVLAILATLINAHPKYTVTLIDTGKDGNGNTVICTVKGEQGDDIDYAGKAVLPDAPEGYRVTWSTTLPTQYPNGDTEIKTVYTEGNYISYFDENGTEIFPWAEEDIYSQMFMSAYYSMQYGYTETIDMGEIMTAADEYYTKLYEEAVEKNDYSALRQFVAKDSEITTASVPSKEGYVGSWDGELPETMGNTAITLTAKYEKGTYTITVVDNGLDDSKKVPAPVEETAAAEETEAAAETPAETEAAEAPAETATDAEAAPAAEATEPALVDNVIFSVSGEYESAVEYGELALPEAPEGYTVRWSQELPETMPGRNVTISAVYEVKAAEEAAAEEAPAEGEAEAETPAAE